MENKNEKRTKRVLPKGYKARIAAALAGFTVNPLMVVKARVGVGTEMASNDYELIGLDYAARSIDCELCGHANLQRVFSLRNKRSNKVYKIGSECAKNYTSVDLVDGMLKIFDEKFGVERNKVLYENEVKLLETARDLWNQIRSYRYGTTLNIALQSSGVLRRQYTLQNGGSPMSVLRKIQTGKYIGKPEQAVIAYWQEVIPFVKKLEKDISENEQYFKDGLAAAQGIGRFFEVIRWNTKYLVTR